MKNIFILIGILTVVIYSCGKKETVAVSHSDAIALNAEISVAGMSCTGCEQTIEAKLTEFSGVDSIYASHVTGKVLVYWHNSVSDTALFRKGINDAGYTVDGISLRQ